jgi:glutathione-regulated potassium-efflux system ancillary protein KefG
VAPKVATEDLIDARGVAEILGLKHRNTVSEYQARYSEMPRPVVDLGRGRPRLWLRSAIEAWAAERAARAGRDRLAGRQLPANKSDR